MRGRMAAGVRRDTATRTEPPSNACRVRIAARKASAWAGSKGVPWRSPPINTPSRGRGNMANCTNASRPSASQASSMGFSDPSEWSTLSPCKPSCRGVTTRSQCAGSILGSSICTVRHLPPDQRRICRVVQAAWRPQPIASFGHGGSRLSSFRPSASRAPGRFRGASHDHGARNWTMISRIDGVSASARASAWRRFPAAPSVTTQQDSCDSVFTWRSGLRLLSISAQFVPWAADPRSRRDAYTVRMPVFRQAITVQGYP